VKVAVLLTGRGNNTLTDKNILPVLGQPLVSYPANAAKRAKGVKSFYVSSDDDAILKIASDIGYTKIKRPKELSTRSAKHVDVILHALDYMKNVDSFSPDVLVVILANSATVKTQWIEQSINSIINDTSISAVVPVYQEQDHHPYRAKRINQNGKLEPFFDFTNIEVSTNRQELESNYFLCHNFWVLNVRNSILKKGGQKPWVFLGNNTVPIIVDECFDVHVKGDLYASEKWLVENI
jgi:CMP-N,N'-diacetyllegionaminic acid synthase